MTPRTARPSRRHQRGVTLFGLMFWAIVVGFVAYVAIRVFPTVNEYLTIQRTINKIASNAPGTVAEIRRDFDKQRDIEYSIVSITGADLVVEKVNERVQISYAYDKEIELFGPVFLLIKYEGRSTTN